MDAATLRNRPAAPALAALAVYVALVVYVCAGFDLNVSALLLLGGKDSPLDAEWFPPDTVVYTDIAGYDGASYYLVALDPFMLDPSMLPEYKATKGVFRYQRVGYPALAWALGMGRPRAILWAMMLINIVAATTATWLVAALLRRRQLSPWLALAFALSPGLLFAAVYDLTEPLSLCLAAWALLLYDRERFAGCWFALVLGLVVRETVVLFVVGLAAYEVTQKRWLRAGALLASGIPAFAYHHWVAYRLNWPTGSGAGFAFTWPLAGMWAELRSVSTASGLVRLAREATVVVWMAFVIACFGLALWGTLSKRSPYLACLGANAMLLLFGYQDWWSTFVNATRTGAGLPLALVVAYVHRRTRFARALLVVAGLLAALGIARVVADAHQSYGVTPLRGRVASMRCGRAAACVPPDTPRAR